MSFINREKKNSHKTQFACVCVCLYGYITLKVQVSFFSWEKARVVSSTKSVFWGFDSLGGILPWPDVSVAGWQDVAKQGRVCGRCIWQEQQ